MSKGTTTPHDTLMMLVGGTTPSYVAGSNVYLALHSADPSAGDQTTSEVTTGAYTGYTRYTLAKSGAWTGAGSTISNAALIQFVACAGGSGVTVTHISIGVAASSTSQILYCGALSSPRAISNGIQPQFAIGALQLTES
jgi:hypothetical protein